MEKPQDIIVAVDAMGGDHGIKVTVPAAVDALSKNKNLKLILVGDSEAIENELKANHYGINERLTIKHAAQKVMMDEAPAKALRFKKDSSMRIAIDLLKNKFAQACVSAGNTGALMATAHYVLKTMPGISRPAIIASLPTCIKNKNVSILDLGANSDSTADNLYQFALMGSILATAHYNIAKPKVGLLNIGAEQIKGNELVKNAAQLFTKSRFFEYIGYIEGDGIFQGEADVVVCDGFVGNIALKTMEGTIKLIANYARMAFERNIFTKISALIAKPALKCLIQQLDPGRYNGASLIGLKGIVIKSHGSANAAAFSNAIFEAALEVEKNIPLQIGKKLANNY